MIKVLLKRRVRPDNYHRLLELLLELRILALHQSGYITGETLVRGNDPIEVLAIGTWLSEDYWEAWSTAQQRLEIEDMVVPLLVGKVESTVYAITSEEA
jgi:antibiotic biosynthesis monooxygenase (ABM) superfamily enzyme